NPHNSFILMNFKFGFMALFFVLLSCFAISVFAFKDLYSLLVLFILIIRFQLDTVAFFGHYTDVLFFVIIYHAFVLMKKKSVFK
ncbi:hypothetical protein L4D09_13890, partial [Photobacterium makurazakiensis]|uniref:hypothetical protein n=1 Tax=Photobacterium makurazakiensis TaxID=2910234 RepID=UPI003D0FBA0A